MTGGDFSPHLNANRWTQWGARARKRIPIPAQNVVGVLDQAAAAAASLLPIIALGRLAGPDDLALFSLSTSSVLFLTLIFQTLVLSAYPVFRAQDRDGSGAQLFYVLVFGLVPQIALLPVLAVIAWAISGSHLDGPSSASLSFYVVTAVARNYLRTVSMIRQELRQILVLDALLLLMILVLCGWLAYAGAVDIGMVAAALSAANIVFLLIWFFSYRSEIQFGAAGGLAYLRRSLSFGRWTLASVMIGSTVYYAPPWLLISASGTRETAVFAAATTIAGIVNHCLLGLLRGIEGLTADSFHSGGVVGLRETLKHVFRTVIPMLSVVVLAVLVAAGMLGKLILPDHWEAAASVARLLSVALLVSSVRVIFGNGLSAMSLPQAALPGSVVLGACALGLGYAGAHYAGAIGVAGAILVGDVASSILLRTKYRAIVRRDAGRQVAHADPVRH